MVNIIKALRKKRERKPKTYTKIVVGWLLTMAVIWVTWSYVLATFQLCVYGNTDLLESLSERVCETIIAAVLGYFLKSSVENVSQYGYKGKIEDEEIAG